MKTKKKQETVAQKALRLLNAVPTTKFVIGDFTNYKGKCCAIGHYMRLTSGNPKNYSSENCHDNYASDLRERTRDFIEKKHGLDKSIANVNNEENVNGYTQKTIKGRVINLLKQMVKEGY